MKHIDITQVVPIRTYNTLTLPAIAAPTPPATWPGMQGAVRRAWGHLAVIVARLRGIDKALMAVGTPAPLDGPVTVEVPVVRPSGQATRREVKVALGLALALALVAALAIAATLAPPAATQAHGPVSTAAHWHTVLPCSHYNKHHPLRHGQGCSTLPTVATRPCSSYDHWHPAPAAAHCTPPKVYPCSHYNQWHPAPKWQGCPAPKGGK